jgi:hypothetical protein
VGESTKAQVRGHISSSAYIRDCSPVPGKVCGRGAVKESIMSDPEVI